MTILAKMPDDPAAMLFGFLLMFLPTLLFVAYYGRHAIFKKAERYRSQGMVEDARRFGLTWIDAAPMSTTFLDGGVFAEPDKPMPLQHVNPHVNILGTAIYNATDIAYRMMRHPTFALMYTTDLNAATQQNSSQRSPLTMCYVGDGLPAMTVTRGSSALTESISFNDNFSVTTPPGGEDAARSVLIPLVMERIANLRGARQLWTEPEGWLCIEWTYPPKDAEAKLDVYASRIDDTVRVAEAIPAMHSKTSVHAVRKAIGRTFPWMDHGPGIHRKK